MINYFNRKERLKKKLFKLALALCATREKLEGPNPIVSRLDGELLLSAEYDIMKVVDKL